MLRHSEDICHEIVEQQALEYMIMICSYDACQHVHGGFDDNNLN